MKALKKQGKYRLYLVAGGYELWAGIYGAKNSYMAGYVSDPANFSYAVAEAQEEMNYLMMEAF